LDPRYTSPYKFYQFWLNVSDADAEKYIKIFTSLSKEEIDALATEQQQAAHLRPLQKALAKSVTCMVHSEEEYDKAVKVSEVLFGNATSDILKSIDEYTFLSVFEGVPAFETGKDKLPLKAADLLAVESQVFPSKGEFRKLVQGGGVSINKEKISDVELDITPQMLLNEKYLLVQKGKKNYFVIKFA
ncbi:MAG: tyrosine--tRNA ligase, partial [Prevotellaceae bacterium]|nr:tyrosine--tRNA ligase [Prevotellaceae bacterium]